MSQPDMDAMAAEVVLLVKQAVTPLQDRIAQLEKVTAAPEIAPEDIAASVAGLLKKELADLDVSKTRIVRDGNGVVKYEIEE